MKLVQHITIYFLYLFLFFFVCSVCAQQTNIQVSGRVLSNMNEPLAGATVTVIHEPTQNKYASITRKDGYFLFFNLKPGGPYNLIVSYVGYETLKEINLYINLNSDHFFAPGNSESVDFILPKKTDSLQGIIVNSNNFSRTKNGTETNISSLTLQSLPSVSRGFQDFIRLVPQAKVTGDGVMSLAGQNNRFNAFFIDGANNNDILGTAANGTNGATQDHHLFL